MLHRSRRSALIGTPRQRAFVHVLALVMIIVQSLPVGTALAANAPEVNRAGQARASAAVPVPCVADTEGTAAQGRDAVDCVLDVGDAPSAETNLAGLVRRPEGVTPTFELASEPKHGTAKLVGSTLTYTPTVGFAGEDALTYRVSDDSGLMAGGTVRLQVRGRASAIPTSTATATPSTTTAQTAVPTQAVPTRTPATETDVATPVPSVVSEEPVVDAPQPTSDTAAQPMAVATPVNTGIDLALTNTVVPAEAFATSAIQVVWSVTNRGTKDAPRHTNRLYLSTDRVIGNDWNLGTAQAGVVRAGARYTQTLRVTLPNVVNKTYYLLAVADAPNAVAETVETNNLLARPIVVRRYPDLVPTMFTASGMISPGTPFEVRWRVGNAGGTPAATHVDRFYLSKDQTRDATDRLVATAQITQALGVNAGYTRRMTFSVPVVPSGVYYLLVLSDAAAQVKEFDETNNVRAVPVSVTRLPVAKDAAFTIGLTETVKVDLQTLATDADRDPLQWSLAVSPTYGLTSLVTSTLTYTPTAAFTESDDLVYTVTDAWGGKAQGRIRFTTVPVKLHVVPGSVMFSAKGQQRTLTVKAYDPLGREVDPKPFNLEWTSNNPVVAQVQAGTGGVSARVTAAADVGAAFVAVRSRTNPDVESAILSISIASLSPNAVPVPDTRIAFPPVNMLPNQPNGAAVSGIPAMANAVQRTAAGESYGGFTPREIQTLIGVTGDYSNGGEVTSFRYPVVLQGPAPAVGKIIVASESAPIMGRVVRIVAQRNGFVLVQLEMVELATAFTQLSVQTDVTSLLNSGFARPEQFLEVDASRSNFSLPGGLQGPPTPQSLNSPAGVLQGCKVSGSAAPIEMKPFAITFDPTIDFDFQIAKDPATKQIYLPVAKMVVKLNFSLQAGMSFLSQAGGVGQLECPLGPSVTVTPPNAGVVGIVNLLLGPTWEFQPKILGEVKIQGGPRFALNAGYKFDLVAEAGFIRTNPNNTGVKWEFPRKFDMTTTPVWDVDGWDGFEEIGQGRIEVKIGLYQTGEGLFVIGGGFWNILDKVTGGAVWNVKFLDDLEKRMRIDFFESKTGPEIKVELATPRQVLTSTSNGASAGLNYIAEGVLKSEAIENAMKKIKVEKFVVPEIKLFEYTVPLASPYQDLKPVKVGLLEGDMVRPGKFVTFEAQVDGPGLYAVELYHDNTEIGDLTGASGSKLTSKWTIPDSVCEVAKRSDDGFAQIDVLGYNKMFNKPIFGKPRLDFIPIPNWLGSFKVTCSEMRVEADIKVNGKPYNGTEIEACIYEGRPEVADVEISMRARDQLKRLRRLDVDSTLDAAVREKLGTGTEETLQDSYSFAMPVGTSPLQLTFTATATGANNVSRIQQLNRTVRLTLVGCRLKVEYDSKWATVDECFEVRMERSREVLAKYDVLFLEEKGTEPGPWSEFRQVGRQVSRGNCEGRVARARGDPHVVTPDGREFDSFALGEFVYLQPRPGKDGITVQVRQERIASGTQPGEPIFMPWTSYNTAIAFRADNQKFEFRSGKLDKPFVNGKPTVLAVGLHSFGAVDIKINSARQVELNWKGYSFVLDQVWTFVELRTQVPRDNSHHGLLGTPNGRESDDMQLPDGTLVTNPFDLANGWRVQSVEQSLFTYAQGKGPQTYNLPQINEPPSREQLQPYLEQARQMLLNTCQTDTLSDVALNNTALELYTGRTPAELASTGICWYEIQGVITNQFVENLPVPGAKVTISSDQTATCETYTDRNGFYSCQIAAQGDIPTFTVRTSGRGTAQTEVTMKALPPMEGTLQTRVDLKSNPTTVEVSGLVKDSLDRPLFNAEIQLEGPVEAGYNRAFAVAQGDGSFRAYLTLDDGTTTGRVGYRVSYNPSWSREPTAPGVVYSFRRPLPSLKANLLNTVATTLELAGSVVRFTGKVAFENTPDVGIPGIRVNITPAQPIDGWKGCDVFTLTRVEQVRNPRTETADVALVGSYVCDVRFTRTTPFTATVRLAGQTLSQIVTVEPAGRGVGDSVPVVADLHLPSGLLRVGGVVSGPDGAAVSGATVTLNSANALAQTEVRTDASGRYTATLALKDNATSATVQYRLSYGTIAKSESVKYDSLLGGQVNVRRKDWMISGGKLTFTGRVINRLAPTGQLTGTLKISTAEGPLCTVPLDLGPYSCSAMVETGTWKSINLRYDASGPWGSQTFSVWTPANGLPGLGEERSFVRDIGVTATTLILRGYVRSTANAGVVGATVRVAVAGGTRFVEGKTKAAGAYELRLTVDQGVTTQNLEYAVSYRTATVHGTASVTVTPNGVTTVSRNWSFGYRTLTLSGTISNPFGAAMPQTTVRVEAPALTTPCVTQTTTGGSYTCVAQTTATGAFSATYALSGVWGSRTLTQTVSIRAGDDRASHFADFTVLPTVARIRGSITAPNGAPLGGVTVTARGAAAFRPASVTSTPDGAYDLMVILNTPAEALEGTTAFTRSLQLNVGYGTASSSRVVQFVAQANSLVDVDADWVLDARTIQFRGNVLNGLLTKTAAPLKGTRVVISSPTLGTLCEWSSAQRFNVSTYACDANVTTDAPFDVRYTLTGAWGSEVIEGSGGTIPPPGGVVVVNRDLSVKPTTLRLTGRVVDRAGQPIARSDIAVASAHVLEGASAETGNDGSFSVHLVVRAGTPTASIDYTVSVNGEPPARRQTTVAVTSGALTAHAETFTFDQARRIVLAGKLVNTADPATTLDGRLLIVAPGTDQQLCDTTISLGRYTCTALIRTVESFALNYRVEAPWGGLTLLNQTVPAQAKSFTRDLAASPRMIRVLGSVRNATAAPVASAKVTIKSTNFVVPTIEGMTTAGGIFTGTFALREGTTSGILDYLVESSGNRAGTRGSFAFTNDAKIITVTQQLTLRTRTISFAGQLRNTLAPAATYWPQSRIVVRSPQHGQLCETYTTGSYRCDVTLDTSEPFDVVYEVRGSWGHATATGRVTTLPTTGTSGTVAQNIDITPTLLRLTGRAVDAREMPVAGVYVSTKSPSVASIVSSRASGSDGRYELVVMLSEVEGTQSGELPLVAQFHSASTTVEVPYSAEAGKINSVDVDTTVEPFQFERRTLVLRGAIINSLAPTIDAARPRAIVTVRAPDGGDWCRPSNGATFGCSIELYDDQPVQAIITASGEWGVAERAVTIDAIPVPGEQSVVEANVEVTAATLRLAGRVVLPNDTGLAAASVRIELLVDNVVAQTAQMQTKADGTYETYMLAPEEARVGKLRYTITYEGIESIFIGDGLTIAPGKLHDVVEKFTFEQRRVRFSGALTNSVLAGTGLPGRVSVSSPDFFSARYCQANVAADGRWTCEALLRSSDPFSVTYRFSGTWGTKDVHGYVDDIPAAGGTAVVVQDATAPATVVRLVGAVADRSGEPLSKARITINGTGVIAPASATTNAAGQYKAEVVVGANVTSGSWNYAISYYKATHAETHAFQGLNPNQLNEVRRSFEISSRELSFNGQVTHKLLPDYVQTGRVRVSSPTATLCEAPTDSQGGYLCRVQGASTAAFSVTYTIFGDWGTHKLVGTVEPGASGTAATITQDLAVEPTLLQLKGVVRSPDSTPLAGVEIDVSGENLSAATPSLHVVTKADGSYSLPITLRDAKLSGTLVYQLRLDGVIGSVSVPYTAEANAISTLNKNIAFVSRRTEFNGSVRNMYAPDLRLSDATVQIYAPELGLLCEGVTDEAGDYSCSAQVLNTGRFRVEYTIISSWGRSQFGGIVEAGAAGATTTTTKSLLAQPTTLHLSGIVTGGTGQPLADAEINVSGTNIIGTAKVKTTTAGRYDLYVMAPAGVGLASIRYQTKQGGQSQVYTFPARFERGALTEVVRDFTFAKRFFHFDGNLSNVHAPTTLLRSTTININSPSHGTLCSTTTDSTNRYRCDVEINTTVPISVEYTLHGDWGTHVVTGTTGTALPPLGEDVEVKRPIVIAPPTLIITGTVRDAHNTPLDNTTITVISNTQVSGLNLFLHAQTSATGTYTLPVILKPGQNSGSIDVRLVRDGLEMNAAVPYTIGAGGSVTVAKNWTVASRRVAFNGVVRDGRESTLVIPTEKVVVSSPVLPAPCTWTATAAGAGSYFCETEITSTAAFSVTYTVSGDWGTSVITGTANAGALGGRTVIDQVLKVAPTIVRLKGSVAGTSGAALANAEVIVSSPAFSSLHTSQQLKTTTNAQGQYNVLAVLRENALTGTISYIAKSGGAATTVQETFTAATGAITTVNKTVTIGERTVGFSGSIVHALTTPAIPVGASSVVVKAMDGEELCTWSPSFHEQWSTAPNFNCSKIVAGTNAFSVTYTIDGDWGTEVFTRTVPAGPTGGVTSVSGTYAVSPATLRLTGDVSDPNNRLLPNMTVAVDGPSISDGMRPYQRAGVTNGSGDYDFFVVLERNVVTGTLQYRTTYQSAAVEAQGMFAASANGATTVERNLKFPARAVAFTGNIRHALIPAMALQASQMTVTAPGQGTICSWNPEWPSSTANCQGQVQTTDPVTATVMLTGTWGTETLTETIAPGDWASMTSSNKTLFASPTTVRLYGTVKNSVESPVDGATVVVEGTSVVGKPETTTDEGEYEVLVLLRGRPASASLRIKVTYQSATQEMTRSITPSANIINDVLQDVRFESRRVDFSGAIVHAAQAQFKVPSRVEISSPALSEPCLYPAAHQPGYATSYTCVAEALSTGTFPVTYTVSADWGTSVITATVPAGAAGSRTTFARQLEVSPTALELTGPMRDVDNKVLDEAFVLVKNAGFSVVHERTYGGWIDLQANAAGQYRGYVLLKSDVLSGTITYSGQYEHAYEPAERSFNVEPNTLTTITEPFTFRERFLIFEGDIKNGLANNAELHATSMSISSPTLGFLCSDGQFGPIGDEYDCYAETTTTAPFSYTLTVTGTWGTNVITRSVTTLPAVGIRTSISEDLMLQPTTLRLHGTVKQGTAAIGDASVQLDGDIFVVNGGIPNGPTSAGGAYDFYAVLKKGVTSGTLRYKVVVNNATQTMEVPFTAPEGQRTTIQQDIDFASRRIVFRGTLEHQTVPEAVVYAKHVVVSSPQAGTLCEWKRDYSSTDYFCTVDTQYAEPFDVQYTVSDEWGSEVVTRTERVVPPAIGGSGEVNYNVKISPTVLHLHGRVLDGDIADPAEAGMPDVRMFVYGSAYFANASAYLDFQTDSEGRYEYYALLKKGKLSGSLYYDLRPGSVTMNQTIPFTATANVVNDLEKDFTVTARQMTFYGNVANAYGSSHAVPITGLQITDANRGTLCNTSYENTSSYYCTVDVTSTAALSLTYTITGTWGTDVLGPYAFADVPPTAGHTYVQRNLEASPTTVRFDGIVTAPGGETLENVRVAISSPIFSGQSGGCGGMCGDATPANTATPQQTAVVVQGYTDNTGRYSIYAPIRTGAVTGTATYHLEYDEASMEGGTVELSGIVANVRTDRTRDLQFTERHLSFMGDIVNHFDHQSLVQADIVTVTDSLGTVLCVDPETESFWCETDYGTTSAFSATVTAAGPWGQVSKEVNVPAGVVGSNTYVDQDVTVKPTTVKVSGRVMMTSGQPMQGGSISIEGPDVLGSAFTYVGGTANGYYTLYVPVRNVATGTFTVTTFYNYPVFKTTTATFNASTGELAELTHNVFFDVRHVSFWGALTNSVHADTAVLATQVNISASDGSTLCSWKSEGGSSGYSCDARVTVTSSFTTTITISGDWGTQTVVGQVGAGSVGSATDARKDVGISPTMVKLTGTVTRAGAAAEDHQIRVSGDALATSVYTLVDGTDAHGSYEIYAILRAGMSSGSLTYTLEGDDTQTFTRTFNAPQAGEINTVPNDFELP